MRFKQVILLLVNMIFLANRSNFLTTFAVYPIKNMKIISKGIGILIKFTIYMANFEQIKLSKRNV